MGEYFLNRNQQPNGDYEVHLHGCNWMPAPENRIRLGFHVNCHSAVAAAKIQYPAAQINGCYFCAGPCHTS